jgi:monothiol glutaredoxin
MSEIRDRIHGMVTGHAIMLFMKGTPDAPQCGFSSRVAMILKDAGKPFAAFDVLSDPTIRQGVKDYGNWPTIPQLYVKGELVGGSDIISEMFTNGELKTLLDSTATQQAPEG